MLDSNFVNLSASGKREEGQLITPLIIKMLSVCQGKNSSTLQVFEPIYSVFRL